MNREMRCRGWNKKEKKMDYDPDGGYCYSDPNGAILEAQNLFILMWFTGLLDKNGKEIYEGDVVKYDDGDAYIGEVKQREDGRYYADCFMCKEHSWHPTPDNTCEIIGNIYENTELLERGLR